jgi:hypothetical protein
MMILLKIVKDELNNKLQIETTYLIEEKEARKNN